jgi:hypothetical protein
MNIEIPKNEPNNEELGDKVKNAYEINNRMEARAELLGINLQKLQDEIDKVGGPDKFREIADEGIARGQEGELYGNRSEGEKKVAEFVKRYNDLMDAVSGLKNTAIATGVIAGVGVGMIYGPAVHLNDVDFYTVFGGTALSLATSVGTGLTAVVKKVQANKQYIQTKIFSMKLDMTGSMNRKSENRRENWSKKEWNEEAKVQAKLADQGKKDITSIDDIL